MSKTIVAQVKLTGFKFVAGDRIRDPASGLSTTLTGAGAEGVNEGYVTDAYEVIEFTWREKTDEAFEFGNDKIIFVKHKKGSTYNAIGYEIEEVLSENELFNDPITHWRPSMGNWMVKAMPEIPPVKSSIEHGVPPAKAHPPAAPERPLSEPAEPKPVWVNGDECIAGGVRCTFIGFLPDKIHVALLFGEVLSVHHASEMTKPIKPEGDDIERYKAAFALFNEFSDCNVEMEFDDFVNLPKFNAMWLNITDTTKYRLTK